MDREKKNDNARFLTSSIARIFSYPISLSPDEEIILWYLIIEFNFKSFLSSSLHK